jgi:L-fuconolactonase
MTRIDAHQHFWRYSPVDHAWMSEAMGALKHDFLPAQLEPLLRSAGFDGCVAVQASQTLNETRWLLELAAEYSFIRGVVGWVNLRSDAVAVQLAEFAANPKLVGVRHVVQDEPDDRFLMGTEFRRGIAKLADAGLVYDLLLYPKHLPVAVELVQEFPEQQFVLDHIAKPQIADGVLSPWDDDLKWLAEFPNVACKLSGMVTEAKWSGWRREDFDPYLEQALEAFGASRLMIGSDWPVCTLAADYATTMGIVTDFVGRLSESERDGILGGNCARIYGIEEMR